METILSVAAILSSLEAQIAELEVRGGQKTSTRAM